MAIRAGTRRRSTDLPPDQMLIDIGAKTIRKYEDILSSAGTIFVNGPMGVFEEAGFRQAGTKAVWEAIAASYGFSVVGGGDSVAAANMFGVSDEVGLHLQPEAVRWCGFCPARSCRWCGRSRMRRKYTEMRDGENWFYRNGSLEKYYES